MTARPGPPVELVMDCGFTNVVSARILCVSVRTYARRKARILAARAARARAELARR